MALNVYEALKKLDIEYAEHKHPAFLVGCNYSIDWIIGIYFWIRDELGKIFSKDDF